MKVLYLSYWNMGDPLTTATVYPALEILQKLDFVETILFVNVERESDPASFKPSFPSTKILHQFIHRSEKTSVWGKFMDFYMIPTMLKNLIAENGINVIIARGAVAGSLAYLVWKKTKTSFIVESFEPHAQYMLESKIWRRFDPRYFFQLRWEQKQKSYALGLMTVSKNYEQTLIDESVNPSKIKVAPCGVDRKLFQFDAAKRIKIRNENRINSSAFVGIYAGKYGGLYLDSRAFEMYKIIFDHFSDFHLIILTPKEYHPWCEEQITKNKLSKSHITLKQVAHALVGDYCSASDFALATYKPGPSRAYLSPVKVGEYWANGLPVLLTKGVGDESNLISDGFGGVLFEPERINEDTVVSHIKTLMEISKEPGARDRIASRGMELRSFRMVDEAYNYFLKK